MLSKPLVVFLLFCFSLFVIECKYVETEDIDINTDSIERERYGSIFKRRKRSEVENSSDYLLVETEEDESNESVPLKVHDPKRLAKLLNALGWMASKEAYIASFLKEFADSDSNITIVGWQNIYDADGSVKEVKGIEFTIPQMPDDDEVGNFVANNFVTTDLELEIPHELIRDMREILEPFEVFGTDPAVFCINYIDNEPKNTIYVDQNEMFFKHEGYVIYNRTVKNASPETVKQIIDFAEQTSHYGVIAWDPERNLIEEETIVNPYVMSKILEIKADTELYVNASSVFTNAIYFGEQDKYEADIVNYFVDAFPEYNWICVTDISQYYLTRDVYLEFKSNFEFKETVSSYSIIGRRDPINE